MFDKLKQINELRKMQAQIKKEMVQVESEGVKVVINGAFEVQEIVLSPALKKEDQERILKECLNEAGKEIQGRLAKNFIPHFF